MPRTKKSEPETNGTTPTPEASIAAAIQQRYGLAIGELAPAIASAFWSELDQAVRVEMVKLATEQSFHEPVMKQLKGESDRVRLLPPSTVEAEALVATR